MMEKKSLLRAYFSPGWIIRMAVATFLLLFAIFQLSGLNSANDPDKKLQEIKKQTVTNQGDELSYSENDITVLDATPNMIEAGFSQVALRMAGFDATKELAYLSIDIMMHPGWKTYWKYSGQSGFPPEIEIEIADKNIPQQVILPPPHRLLFSDDISIGYDKNISILVGIKLEDLAGLYDQVSDIKINYAVCEEICAPEFAHWKVKLPTKEQLITSEIKKADEIKLTNARVEVGSAGPQFNNKVKFLDKTSGKKRVFSQGGANILQKVEPFASNVTNVPSVNSYSKYSLVEFTVENLVDPVNADVFIEADRLRAPSGGIVEILEKSTKNETISARFSLGFNDNPVESSLLATIVDGDGTQYRRWIIPPNASLGK